MNVRLRQNKRNHNHNYNLMGFDIIEINLVVSDVSVEASKCSNAKVE